MSTTESKTRGYSMTSAWAYVDATYDSAVREKIVEQLSPEVRKALGTYKDIEFYPAVHFGDVLRGVGVVVGKDDAGAEKEIEACGGFIARQATNTFLRLIMRVLTPTLFAKKIPSLWSRDNTNGAFSVDFSGSDKGRLIFTLSNIADYPYVAPCAKGWIGFAMKTMGRTVDSMKLTGWSLANPSPNEVKIDLQLAQ